MDICHDRACDLSNPPFNRVAKIYYTAISLPENRDFWLSPRECGGTRNSPAWGPERTVLPLTEDSCSPHMQVQDSAPINCLSLLSFPIKIPGRLRRLRKLHDSVRIISSAHHHFSHFTKSLGLLQLLTGLPTKHFCVRLCPLGSFLRGMIDLQSFSLLTVTKGYIIMFQSVHMTLPYPGSFELYSSRTRLPSRFQ